MKENIENRPSPDSFKVIEVKLGKPFKISPDFEDFHGCTIKYYNSIELNIKGLGRGRINLVREDKFQDNYITSTPAGSFKVEYVKSGNVMSPILETVPLTVEVEIDKLTKKQLGKVDMILVYDGKEYRGQADYDDVELSNDGVARLTCEEWVDPIAEPPARGISLFPQDPKIFNKMDFIIKKR